MIEVDSRFRGNDGLKTAISACGLLSRGRGGPGAGPVRLCRLGASGPRGDQGRIFAARYSPIRASSRSSLSAQSWKPNARALLVLKISSQVRSRVASR